MATIFFSCSHKDEELRDRLETALASMKRQGLIEAWHDRRLVAGDDFDHKVRSELERADVILLLVSPDFIASDYCYDVEMARALERHARGEARVIPVILRACDWHSTPFGKFLAAPRDGKPIRSWPDLDEAFLDVARSIRDALPKPTTPSALPAVATPVADRDRFLDEAYDFMAKFFEASLEELKQRNSGIETTFKRIDANRFTAVVYQAGRAVSRGSVVLGGMFGRGISYSADDRAASDSFNESLLVENDEQGLFLKPLGMQSLGRSDRQKLTYEGAAEHYWGLLVRPMQGR